MASTKTLMSYSIRRFIFTSCVNNKSNVAREGRFMGRIMYGNTSKKKWHVGKTNSPFQPFTPSSVKVVSPQVQRRLIVLNKIFMEAITGIMATGEMSRDIIGRSVEISRVQMSTDFTFLRVYWFSTEKNPNKQIETGKLLDKCANRLRYEVTQMRVVGIVPPILFVRDKKLGLSAELEKLMLTADYGDDYVPALTPSAVKPELTLYSKLSDDVREKIIEINKNEFNIDLKELDDVEKEDNDDLFNVNLPVMKHDVLGLNHWAIMSRIKQSLSKAQTARNHRSLNEAEPIEQRIPFDPTLIKPLRTEEESQAFSNFLLQRKIEEKRREKYELAKLNTQITDGGDEDENDENYEEYDIDELDKDDFDDIDPEQLR